MTQPMPEVKFVGFGREPEYARHLWQAALGEIEAHIVHYGETSFATVFTDKRRPQIQDERANFLLKAARGLLGQKNSQPETFPSQIRDQFAAVVIDAAAARSIPREDLAQVIYLQPMRQSEARHFAEDRQMWLESQAGAALEDS